MGCVCSKSSGVHDADGSVGQMTSVAPSGSAFASTKITQSTHEKQMREEQEKIEKEKKLKEEQDEEPFYDPIHSAFAPITASLIRPSPHTPVVLRLQSAVPWAPLQQVLEQQRKAEITQKFELDKLNQQNQASDPSAVTDSSPPASDASSPTPISSSTPTTSSSSPLVMPPVAPCVVFNESVKESNIVGGSTLADSHIISVLASLAQSITRLMRLFPALDAEPGQIRMGSACMSAEQAKTFLATSASKFQPSKKSKTVEYEIRLFCAGDWRTLYIDSMVPVTDPSHSSDPTSLPRPLFVSSRDGIELWPALLEKALAKLRGSYNDLLCTSPLDLYRHLTGGIGEVIELNEKLPVADQDKLWADLLVSYKRKDIMSVATKRGSNAKSKAQQKPALVPSSVALRGDAAAPASHGHSHSLDLGSNMYYSVMDVFQLPPDCGQHRVILLRNPTGHMHWEGEWSSGTAVWQKLQETELGRTWALKLHAARKKHFSSRASYLALLDEDSEKDGMFYVSFNELMSDFSQLYICQVLADNYDFVLNCKGSWRGTSAVGNNLDTLLLNPSFRIRNTLQKKSGPLVITLRKGWNDNNQMKTSFKKAHIGFKIITNQMSHTINTNPSVSSPMFGVVQPSPLHDDIISSKLTNDVEVSVTLPSLEPSKDYFLIPYTLEAGVEGNFVFSVFTSTPDLQFHACVETHVTQKVEWKNWNKTAAGNFWSDNYLNNPIYKIVNNGSAPSSLLLNLTKSFKSTADFNINLRVCRNTAPASANSTGVGFFSAPMRTAADELNANAGLQSIRAELNSIRASKDKNDDTKSSSQVRFADMIDSHRKRSSPTILPVKGTLCPFYEVVSETKWSKSVFYGSQANYPLIINNCQPGVEYFVVPSTFTAGQEGECSLRIYGAHIKEFTIEQVNPPQNTDIPPIVHFDAGWHNFQAAGPQRRAKSYLFNPQFCLRHFSSQPISVAITLSLPPVSHSELAVNLAVVTFPSKQSDPNPLSNEEIRNESARQDTLKSQPSPGNSGAGSTTVSPRTAATTSSLSQKSTKPQSNAPVAVQSLRIRTKFGGKDNTRSLRSDRDKRNGMFDLDEESESPGVSPMSLGNHKYANPLVGEKWEMVEQTNWDGELYKAREREYHLFVSDLLPHTSYFIIPSTSLPGQGCDFHLSVYGNTELGRIAISPCMPITPSNPDTAGGIASRRAHLLANTLAPSGTSSFRAKHVLKEGVQAPKHEKRSHR